MGQFCYTESFTLWHLPLMNKASTVGQHGGARGGVKRKVPDLKKAVKDKGMVYFLSWKF